MSQMGTNNIFTLEEAVAAVQSNKALYAKSLAKDIKKERKHLDKELRNEVSEAWCFPVKVLTNCEDPHVYNTIIEEYQKIGWHVTYKIVPPSGPGFPFNSQYYEYAFSDESFK